MFGISGRVMNPRPLLLPAVCLAAGIVLGFYIGVASLYISSAAALISLTVFLLTGRVESQSLKARFSAYSHLIAGALFLLLGAALCTAVSGADYADTGSGQTVTGVVYSEPYSNDFGSVICYIEDARIDGKECGNIKLYLPEDADVAPGDVIMANADTHIPPGVRNPGGFDERLHLLTQGIYYKAYAQNAQVVGGRTTPFVMLANIRMFAGRTIDNLFEPDVAPLVRGMLLGDKYDIDENTASAFKDSGMAHVLAVSGLHAGILIAAVYGLFSLLRLGRRQKLIAALLFITLYACAAGLTPSIVRASIMASVLIIGRHTGRQTDTLSSLALAFIISLIINPLDLFSAGFLLSYGAVFGLLTVSWQLNRIFNKIMPKAAAKAVSASVGATAGTLPVMAAVFNRVSLLGLIANIVILPLCSLAIVLCFATVVLGLVVGDIAQYLGYAAAAVVRLMTGIVKAIGVLPFAAVNAAAPPWYAVLGSYLVLFICSKYVLIKTKAKAFLSAALAAVVAAALLIPGALGMYVVFLDVGEGDAVFLRTLQGGEYFIDGGREQAAQEVLSFAVRKGITPDAAFVTHTDSDHFAGIVRLYDEGLLNKVYCSRQEQNAVSAAMPKAQIVPLSAGDTVALDDYTKAVVLYPYRQTQAQGNDASLVLRIEYGGYSILLTGDISGLTETELFCSHDRVDIYKAAHHGSKSSSYRLPLSVLSPKYSVISVGDNPHGHPHKWAVQNLNDYSERLLITKHDYAVEFFIDREIIINTFGRQENGG